MQEGTVVKEDTAEENELSGIDFSNSIAKDKIQYDEETNEPYIMVDTWDSTASDNLDCVSRILRNVYGIEYNTTEGHAAFEALAAANPTVLDVNNPDLVNANARINLIDLSSYANSTTEGYSDEDLTQSKDSIDKYINAINAKDGENNSSVTVDENGQTIVDLNGDSTNDVMYIKDEENRIYFIDDNADGDWNGFASYDGNGNITEIMLGSMNDEGAVESNLVFVTENSTQFSESGKSLQGKNVLLIDQNKDGSFESAVEFDSNNDILTRYTYDSESDDYVIEKEDDKTSKEKTETDKSTEKEASTDEKTETEKEESEVTDAQHEQDSNEEIIENIQGVSLEDLKGYKNLEEKRQEYLMQVQALAKVYATNSEYKNSTYENKVGDIVNWAIDYDSEGNASKIKLGSMVDNAFKGYIEYNLENPDTLLIYDEKQGEDTPKGIVYDENNEQQYIFIDENGNGILDEEEKKVSS